MSRWVRWVLVIALAGILGAWWWQHRAVINPSAFRDWIRQFGSLSPLIYVGLYAANTVTLVPPIGILSLSAGLVFGPFLGFLVIMAGAMIGTVPTFFISRKLGAQFVEKRLKGKFRSFDEALKRRGLATVFFLRAVPIVPYEVMNYASGLSRIKFRDYWLGTFLGLIPGAAVAAFFGDALTQPNSPKFVAAAATMGIFIAIPAIYWKVKRKPKNEPH